MNADLNKYLKLQAAITNEKAKIEARLNTINQVLGGAVPRVAVPAATPTGKRTFSAATKAKMAIAQKARWATLKGKPAAPAPATPSAPAPKRKMSAAGKANIRAAVKARWAKIAAAKAKAGK